MVLGEWMGQGCRSWRCGLSGSSLFQAFLRGQRFETREAEIAATER